MPFYQKLGEIPSKRHTIFKSKEDKFYYEQLFGTEGFHGMSSLLYHVHRPTQIKTIGKTKDLTPKPAVDKNITPRMLKGFTAPGELDYLESRKVVLFNNDVHISLASPKSGNSDFFYKNADADEVIFIHEGTGLLKTLLGTIEFSPGDYLVIPRGMIYQIHFNTPDNRLFIVDSFSPIYTPKRYRNHFGQLLEHSPFCERDIRGPERLETHDEKGEFLIKIKKENTLQPITGRVHQPPPVHQTFEAHNFVICSFCPRLYDYHPQAIPAPYNHSNIDSDEVLYYVDGDFMSRSHVEKGYVSLHPGGIPHGPHPGTMEKSIGKKETKELAVMVDTFRPLKITQLALDIEDNSYKTSWLD